MITIHSDGWYTSNTHWRLNWDEGGTEGGSSGSPLFDDENIVGQLHGGSESVAALIIMVK